MYPMATSLLTDRHDIDHVRLYPYVGVSGDLFTTIHYSDPTQSGALSSSVWWALFEYPYVR